ncbi:MAG: hypothetical protein FJ308_08110 [Planctomycetes bacterium]|nr:hypothetical protein [Planctomycetota bacterium]
MMQNSLAFQPVVFEVLRDAADSLLRHCDNHKRKGTDLDDWMMELSGKVADIFLGNNENYAAEPGWNEPGKIDEWIVSQIPMGVKSPKERVQMLILQFFSDLFDLANFANTPGVLDEQWKSSWTQCFIDYCGLLMGVPEIEDETVAFGALKQDS